LIAVAEIRNYTMNLSVGRASRLTFALQKRPVPEANALSAMGVIAAMNVVSMGASAAVSEILRLGIRRLVSAEIHREPAMVSCGVKD